MYTYICIRECTCIYIHICTHVYKYVYMFIMYMYMCIYISICIFVRLQELGQGRAQVQEQGAAGIRGWHYQVLHRVHRHKQNHYHGGRCYAGLRKNILYIDIYVDVCT